MENSTVDFSISDRFFLVLAKSGELYVFLGGSSSSFEGYPLQARHKQDWGRGFILLLPQTAALPDQMLAVVLLRPHRVRHPKPSDLVLHVVPDA